MCGINGLFGDYSFKRIHEMNSVLEHRGPDQCGVTEVIDQGVLSLNRLSILDPSEAGKQPMGHDDVTISYNGEIYNYQSLRNQLEQHNYSFSSDTDTEVILKGYHHAGESWFNKLNGIFAFVIVDERGDGPVVHLCRDPLGIKPLYYYTDEQGLIISSEIKGVIAGLDTSVTQDGLAIHEYFGTRGIAAESLFDEINAVEAGGLYTYDPKSRTLETDTYDNIYDYIQPDRYKRNKQRSEEELIDELDQQLRDAIERQLVADVPVATICSGGVDSSLVTAIASEFHDDIQVYHVSVDHPEHDESNHARRVAKHLDLDLHVKTLDRETYLSLFEESTYYNDLPLTHPNSVGVAAVNSLANEDGVKVLLTGEGADELFGGYSRYSLFYNMLRLSGGNPARICVDAVTDVDWAAWAFLDDDAILEYALKDQFGLSNEDLTLTGHRRELLDNLYSQLQSLESGSRLKSLAYMMSDLDHYLPVLLRRADRMSMQASIEARVPMLDLEVARFGMNIPHEYKIKGGENKYLLKKVAERYLPDEIVYRDKSGFPIPVDDWLAEGGYDVSRGYKNVFYNEWRDQYVDISATVQQGPHSS